jgi:glutamate/tyrosine decarboxylase-like PLP-dependent enzyme
MAVALADAIDSHPLTELIMRPELGVVLFRRAGWAAAEWKGWATALLRSGTAFVAPSTYKGEPVGRVVFMHPRTPDSIVGELMLSLSA